MAVGFRWDGDAGDRLSACDSLGEVRPKLHLQPTATGIVLNNMEPGSASSFVSSVFTLRQLEEPHVDSPTGAPTLRPLRCFRRVTRKQNMMSLSICQRGCCCLFVFIGSIFFSLVFLLQKENGSTQTTQSVSSAVHRLSGPIGGALLCIRRFTNLPGKFSDSSGICWLSLFFSAAAVVDVRVCSHQKSLWRQKCGRSGCW